MASYEQAKALLNHSVSRPTLYSLDLTGSNINGVSETLTPDESNYIKLFCNNIEFPGLAFDQELTIGQEAMGIQRTVPGGMIFDAANRLRFSVIENSDFGVYNSLRKLFNSAMAEGGNPIENNRAQRMNYYDDYKFNAQLSKLEFPNNEDNIPYGDTSSIDYGYKVVAKYTFENCYVSRIDGVNYNSAEQNTFTSFVATLRFENYYHDKKIHMYGDSRVSS